MGAVENGKPIESTKDRPNGHPVGGPVATIRRSKAPTRSWSAWLINSFARIAVWYTILTILIRCPSNPASLDESSPRICKPYLSTRDYVQPHVQPYYDTYASPYVDKLKPYAEQINGKVIVPATILTKRNYQKFAAPQIDKARAAGQAQWEKSVVPQIQLAQAQATKLYDANIAPHVQKVSGLTGPYYVQARNTAQTVHKDHVLPALDIAGPYLQKGYASTQTFLLGTAYPIARHGWSNTVIFVDGTLWPFLKGVYSDNVRPQLVMISERISKYQERRKLQAIVDGIDDASTAKPVAPETTIATSGSSVTSSSTTVGPSATLTDSEFEKIFADEEETTAAGKDSSSVAVPVPKRERATDDSIAKDLREWQTKFALAADKGMDDLKERAGELAADLAKSDIQGLGRGLENALQRTIDNELETVKAKIIAAVSILPEEDSSEAEKAAAEDIVKTIRSSGLEIKEKAKKVRDWAQKFERDVDTRIARAATSTLEVIDGIRDLGLQEIGMRWAWMDGVTYKHWEKFHELKRQLHAWSNEVRAAAIEHPEASAAKDTARQILEESMALTEDAAKELVKLKEVAKWKIRAHDTTDDFELRAMPAAAASVAKEFAASSASLFGDAQETIASVASDASSAADDILSSASSAVLGSRTGSVESVASDLSDTAEAFASSASSVIIGTSTGSGESAASAISSGAGELYDDLTNTIVEFGTATETISLGLPSDIVESASSVVLGSSGTIEKLASSGSSIILGSTGAPEKYASDAASIVSEAGEAVADSASSVILGTTGTAEQMLSSASSIVDDASDVLSDAAEQATASATSVVSKGSSIFAGAMAQEVKGGQVPIFDDFFDNSDDDSYSSKLQDMVNSAGDGYADLTSAVFEAIYGKPKGPMDKATSVAAAQYSQAMQAASSVLFPPPQGTVASIASMATERYSEAVEAARQALNYGTPTPTIQIESILASMTNQAEAAYSSAIKVASERYAEGKSIASEQVIGTTKPVHERMFSAIESAWEGASVEAKSRHDAALSAASSHYSALSSSMARTSGPMASISAVAASRLEEALSLASLQYSSAKAAIGATPTPQHQQYLNSARRSFYEGIGFAQDQYTQFLHSASHLVYPTPTPAYQSAVDAYASATSLAADNMASLLAAASSAVGKKKKTPAQSILDKIQSQYDVAILEASKSLSAASSAASTAVYGTQTGSIEAIQQVAAENWQAIVAQASQQLYATSKPFYEEYASSADDYYQNALSQAGDSYDSAASKAGEYASQITDGAGDQYAAVQAYVSELILGKEPDFSESVMSRLQSAYYTGVASYASEVYVSASSVASSISSAASEYFQPPPAYTNALDSFQSQLDAAVSAASVQIYGTEKGTFEQASEAVADSYKSVSSAASEAIYGTEAGYAESATLAFAAAASQAQDAVSLALFGTPTGTAESMASAAGETYTSVTKVIAENIDAAQSVVGAVAQDVGASVSSLIYGPEQGALESAQSQISAAVQSAQAQIALMASQASKGGAEAVSAISSNLEEAASVVSSSVSAATDKIKDEL